MPFYESRVVRIAQKLREMFTDYIDCVIIATAAARVEPLLTEDHRILNEASWIEHSYGVEVRDYGHLSAD